MAYVPATAAADLKTRIEAISTIADEDALDDFCEAMSLWITDWLPTLVVATTVTGTAGGDPIVGGAGTGGVS